MPNALLEARRPIAQAFDGLVAEGGLEYEHLFD
jgi:hypothetical protein